MAHLDCVLFWNFFSRALAKPLAVAAHTGELLWSLDHKLPERGIETTQIRPSSLDIDWEAVARCNTVVSVRIYLTVRP